MLRILTLILLLATSAGCMAGEEKNIFQMARVNQKEIVEMKVTHAGKTIALTDRGSLSLLIAPMGDAAPAVDAANTRLGSSLEEDYVIDVFVNPAVQPAKFYYNSEKQWLFYVQGSKRYHPYKCEELLQPLSGLFGINSFRGVVTEKEGLPKYFELTGWLGKNKFYGLQGDQLSVWDTENGTAEPLLKNVWTVLLSPDHSKLAYTNQKGLNIFDIKTLTTTTAVKAGRDPAGGSAIPSSWSPDSGLLMYVCEHEWYSDFYILDLATNQSKPFVLKDVNNFLSTPVAWLKNGNLLFTVSAAESKEGARVYMSAGYRCDLVEVDPEGNARPVTQMEDYKYISFAGLTENEKDALVIIRDKTGAGRKAAMVDLSDGNVEYLPLEGHTISAGVSPDGRFVAATAPLELDHLGYRLELLDRYAGRIIFHYENRSYGAEKRFLWSPDGKRILYLDRSLEDASNNKLKQIKILPE